MRRRFLGASVFALISVFCTSVMAYADQAVADGDLAVTAHNSLEPLEFGTICAGGSQSKDAVLGARRNGNGVGVWDDSAVLTASHQSTTVAAGSPAGTTAAVAIPASPATDPAPGTSSGNKIRLPSNWDGQPNNVISALVTIPVTLQAGVAPGSFQASVVLRLTGAGTVTGNQPGTLSHDASLVVNATISNTGSCAPSSSNTAPSVAFVAPATAANEGDTVSFSFTITDPDADTWSYAATYPSCGTGTVSNASIDQSSKTGSFDCTFPDGPAEETVKVKISDGSSSGNEASAIVQVANVAPTVSSAFVTGVVQCGANNASLSISWSDPGVDDHTVVVDWGDGTSAESFGTQTSPFTPSHTYASAGAYNATVTVTDSDLDAGQDTSNSLTVEYTTSGILQPVNWTQAQNPTSIFRYGSTIPVKVRFFDCDGSSVSGLSVSISVKKTAGNTPVSGDNENITNTNAPDSGGYMRWSDTNYLYNLNTRSLSDSTATYEITLTVLATGQQVKTLFGTRAK